MTEIEALMNEHIRTLKPYSTARDDFKGKADILLDANESWLGGSGINRYPDPRCTALRKEIEKVLSLPFDMTAVTNGSDEAIDLLIRIFCRPGIDSVMIERPTYGAYRVFADLNGVEVIDARLKEDYTLDIPRMEVAIDERKPKIVFICSPNNPTGSLYSKEDILRIADANKGITVIDEAYIDFSVEEGMWRAIEENPRIVVLRTMSKAWSLAGARVGIIVSDPEIQRAVMKAKPPYNVSQLSQQAALDMLARKDEIAGTLSQILSERERLSAFFRTLPFISEVFHSDSNFILVRTSDAERLYDYLAARSIIVRNRSSEPLLQGCLRITVGNREENDKLMEVLDGYSL